MPAPSGWSWMVTQAASVRSRIRVKFTYGAIICLWSNKTILHRLLAGPRCALPQRSTLIDRQGAPHRFNDEDPYGERSIPAILARLEDWVVTGLRVSIPSAYSEEGT